MHAFPAYASVPNYTFSLNSRQWSHGSLSPPFLLLPISEVPVAHADLRANLGATGALHLPCLGAGNVVGGDPVGIVGGSRGNGRAGALLDG